MLLLKYFLTNCDNGYKVLEVSKIFDDIRKYKRNFQSLSDDIKFLAQQKLIDVKYIDENNLCVCTLDNSRIIQENIKSDRLINRKYSMMLFINMVLSGVMAFAGAFLAIILLR